MRARLVAYLEIGGYHRLTFAVDSEARPKHVVFTQYRPDMSETYRVEDDIRVELTGYAKEELTHFINRPLKDLMLSYHGVFLEMPAWFFGYGDDDKLREACERLSRAKFPLGNGAEINFRSNSYDGAGTTTWTGTLMHEGEQFKVEEPFLEDALVQLAAVFRHGTEKTALSPVLEPLATPAPGYPLAELVKAVPELEARRALLLIAEYLDGQEWDSDTCADVAGALMDAGIPVGDIK